MSKLYIFSIIFGIFFLAGNVLATVGGPTYISRIAFNKADNSVYYIVSDYGGRGCPSIINKINLSMLVNSEVKSCDEIESEYYGEDYEKGMRQYDEFILDTYQDLSHLGSVSLKKNNIDIKVEFLSEHIEFDFIQWTDFRAIITQDNKKIGEINFRGCAKDQPHIFEGYVVPSSDAMVILISNKGDCFEAGYVNETLHIIKGIKYYNTDIVRDMKTEGATEPNLGNMVVYAMTTEAVPITGVDNTNNNKIPYAILAVIILLGLAYVLGRNAKN